MHTALPATGGKWGMVCKTCAGPGVLLLSRPVAIYALTSKVQLSQSACLWMCPTLPAWAQLWAGTGAGPLGAWTGWFVAAGMGSSSEATGRLVLSLARLWQWHHCPCFIQRPSTTLRSGRSGPTPSFASLCCLQSGCTLSPWPVLPSSYIRDKDVQHSRTLSWDFKSISQSWRCCSYATRYRI